ncbi:MAG: hypothetical protein AABX37_05195, partial [Nanoarchaeota archaeon]
VSGSKIFQRVDFMKSVIQLGIRSVPKQNQDILCDLLPVVGGSKEFRSNHHKYHIIGAGSSAIVLLNERDKVAYKISKGNRTEYYCYREINFPTVHVLRPEEQDYEYSNTIFGEMIPFYLSVIKLPFINGRSLSEHLCNTEPLPPEKIMKYCSGIFFGLLELRQAGIYHHRDLRPANIMIDEEKDRAVIIDLGIATTDKDALAKDNRRFGSPTGQVANDLNSLGQIMYKMATGEHIFAESKSMERTTYADQVRDHRDWIYEDHERLRPYLETVERRVEDPTLRDIVVFCLRSRGTDEDYDKLNERFRAYDIR